MAFKDRMRTEAIPERVYALCRLVELKNLNKDQLKDFLQPTTLDESRSIFAKVLDLAVDVGLIEEDADGFYQLIIDQDILSSVDKFRKFMSNRLYSDKDSALFKLTSWYLKQNQEIFKYSAMKHLQNDLKGELIKLREEDLLAWRFWVSFLGNGFLHDGIVIPNTSVRIKDRLEGDIPFEYQKKIFFGDFIDWLKGECPELEEGLVDNQVCYGISAGLRTLHDQGFLSMNILPDSTDIWHLYRIDTHDISEDVSEIEIKGDINE